jgi:hypothetical protein
MQPRTESEVSEKEKRTFANNLPEMIEAKRFEEIISQLPTFLKEKPEDIIEQLIYPYEKAIERKKSINHWIQFFILLQDSSVLPSKMDFSSLWIAVLKKTVIKQEEHKQEDVQLFYTKFIQMLITQHSQKNPAILEHLASNNNFLSNLSDAFSYLSPELKKDIQNKLIHFAIEKYNPFLLEMLTQEIPLKSITPLETKEKATQLLEIKKESWGFLHEHMKAFVNGFGNISYPDALLTCAQIAARKKYFFQPTILGKPRETDTYFSALSHATFPIREKFIITGGHFYPCDIIIDEKKHATLLITDSLSVEDQETVTVNTLIAFKKYFPNSTIYLPAETRLKSIYGCSVFSLDDLQHLYTIEQYLPPEYKKENGLFDYLKAHSEKEFALKISPRKNIPPITVNPCQLPLALERTRQNENILKEVIPSRTRENKLPVNKRGETAMESTSKFFQEATNKKGEKKFHNKRLERQLKKIATYNANYIVNNSIQTIEHSMQSFTLKAFQHRMQQRSLEAPMRENLGIFLNAFHDWLKSYPEKKVDLLFTPTPDSKVMQCVAQALTDLKKEDTNVSSIAKMVSEAILEYKKLFLTSKPITEFLSSFHITLEDLNKVEWVQMLVKPDQQNTITSFASKLNTS